MHAVRDAPLFITVVHSSVCIMLSLAYNDNNDYRRKMQAVKLGGGGLNLCTKNIDNMATAVCIHNERVPP